MKEASSEAAASAFMHGWLGLFGVPSKLTSDNGGSFSANLWKDIMAKLNIEVTYSPLYRPQAVGMLERQHRSLKDSLKAAIEDMGQKYQDKWMDFLPLVLLGRSASLQPDIGASPSEMTFGTNVKIPGQLLSDLTDKDSVESLKNLLHETKKNTLRAVSQPSRHNPPERPLPGIPDGVTHVYTKQHQTTGLQTAFQGPFPLVEKLSKSTVKIEVGVFKNGDKRYEVRHLNDLKFAHPESLAAPASRPALGRKPTSLAGGQSSTGGSGSVTTPSNNFPSTTSKQPVVGNSAAGNHETSNPISRVPASVVVSGLPVATGAPPSPAFTRPVRATRNPCPQYVDAIWVASKQDLDEINRSISRRI